jgi:mannose-6-phosphate isomerase
MSLYPLKFRPILIEKVWGGRRLARLTASDVKPIAVDRPSGDGSSGESNVPIGELWALSDLEHAMSVVENGPLAGRTIRSVTEEYGETLLGRLSLGPAGDFPLLIKYLDAAQNLSVQVHPDEEYVSTHPDVRLKSEAWYVLDADPGAVIYRGMREGVTRDEFRARVESGENIEELMHAIEVKPGQCYYLPAGTCHALGAGVLVAEVQTPADTTFRVYDWGRTDRELHIDQAMECINFSPTDTSEEERRTHIGGVFTTVTRLCTTDHFIIEKVRMSEGYGQEIPYDRPAIWMVLDGAGRITNTPAGVDVEFNSNDVVLIPARMTEARVELSADTVWLDVQFPELMSEIELA